MKVMHLVKRAPAGVAAILAVAVVLAATAAAQSVPAGVGRYGTAKRTKATATAVSPSLKPMAAIVSNDLTASQPIQFAAQTSTASASQKITLTNTSKSSTYTVELDSLSGEDLADFVVTPCANMTIKPGGTCDLLVTYKPNAAGTSTATLNLTSTNLATGATQSVSIQLSGIAAATCMQPPHSLLPISMPGTTNAQINCFFDTSSNLAFVTQAQYLYNPGGSANTVSGDLVSLQFPGGVQISLAGNANVTSCSNSSSGSTGGSGTNPTNSTCGTSPSGSTPSLSQDEQAITTGGDFALKGLWPILNWRGAGSQVMAFAAPKMGFNINGLAGQNTATAATEVNENLSAEFYYQLNAIPPTDGGDSPGSIFVDYRGGWEHVSSDFATNAGLKSGNNFGLQEISGGIVINGSIRISAQRYFGPEQAFVDTGGNPVTVNNFKNWQLAIQLTPTNVKKN